ncbi:uncharacterized protein BO96DRAFT_438296 [Aspergillus niger CBS 101883]|uniref:Uncharacterized protein n=2 Tax=Aspergillus niger TaxID=5061 RepID=A2QK18_ASPNC|nr:uncharacterized protein BO96DRAFT_438296 [Aspergillus niger CBS 101883]XP_059600686.1 hypothetical protein An04g09040 [Aspergillus niger]PYH52253.1 hypothetical protein BO96DRAFT_438296 [Aspergillus niger CBS 101883]CAK38990.1 hypothetical protein An04g09040 [Aspergillus niger]
MERVSRRSQRTGTISEVHRKAQKYGEIRKYNYVPRLYPPRIPNIRKAVLGNEDPRRARLQRTGRGGSYDGEAEEASLDERKQCRRLRTVDQQPNALENQLGTGCSCLLKLILPHPEASEAAQVTPTNGAQIGTSSPCGPKVAWPKVNELKGPVCQCVGDGKLVHQSSYDPRVFPGQAWGRSSAEVLSPSVGADSVIARKCSSCEEWG